MDPMQSVAVFGIAICAFVATLMWHLAERKYARLVSYHTDVVGEFENDREYLTETRIAEVNALTSQLWFLGAKVSYDDWQIRSYAISSERNQLRPLAQVASDLRAFRQLGTPVSDAEIAHARREIDDIFG